MNPCNCTTRCCQCACSPGAPLDTSCITVKARDVLVGDYLDTRDLNGRGFLAQVFGIDRSTAGRTTLDVVAERAVTCSPTKRVKVWRDSRVAAARPIDLRTDRPFRTLNEVHRAGREGLNAAFPIGSLWEVGPFQPNVDPEVVRIIASNAKSNGTHGGAAFSEGVNYSASPDATEACGRPCWYVNTETIYDPFHTGKAGCGQPPHVLGKLTPRMAAKIGVACCDCAVYVPPCSCRVLSCNAGVIQSMRAEAESLRNTITEQDRTVRKLEAKLAGAQLRAHTAERVMAQVRLAVNNG